VRDADLAHDMLWQRPNIGSRVNEIKRRVKSRCNFCGNCHPAARQRKDDRFPVTVDGEGSRKPTSGVGPILEGIATPEPAQLCAGRPAAAGRPGRNRLNHRAA
jgi:hypothetical protein